MNFRKAITYYFEDCYGDEKLTRTPKIQSQIEAYWMYVVVCLLYLFTLFMVLSHSNFVLNKALEGSYIPVILFFLFWSYSLFTFISLRNSDPGIIPGLKYQEPEPIEKEEREEKSETLKERKKKKEEVLKQDIPERAKYCRKCEGYIAKYDHHCFWIGICVGEKNHYKFIRFLITQIVFIVVALIIAAHGFYLKIYQFQKLNQFQMPILLLISTLVILVGFFIGFFLVWLPVIMLSYHLYLVATNQTSYETARPHKCSYFEGVPKEAKKYDLGCIPNCKDFFCESTDRFVDWKVSSEKNEGNCCKTACFFCINEQGDCCCD